MSDTRTGSAPGPVTAVSRSTIVLPRTRRLCVDGPPTSTRKKPLESLVTFRTPTCTDTPAVAPPSIALTVRPSRTRGSGPSDGLEGELPQPHAKTVQAHRMRRDVVRMGGRLCNRRAEEIAPKSLSRKARAPLRLPICKSTHRILEPPRTRLFERVPNWNVRRAAPLTSMRRPLA
jgi:hypothetical protein